ncbi:hypothetical protein FRC14_002773 [Serendipita sp. 396]|nr:hypothetical protein FRC14_002773 [Serendipita sp. 396]KAG8789682.1 hypothetical protein FRC15_003751 [Serendipita sp. 397]KAG8803995.1 hypothetical protein FRC16_001712 [Serendipita sp. 398]KAG8837005.1 hypothetical protein FRC18_010243 [Serendipita sp. 400]KAG8876298.1 hypothetical protein FRC20_001801 [Serendipita sp. 405]
MEERLTNEEDMWLPVMDGDGTRSKRKRWLENAMEPRSSKRFKPDDHYYSPAPQHAYEEISGGSLRAPPPYDMSIPNSPLSSSHTQVPPMGVMNGSGHRWMFGKPYLDAPIRLPAHEETISAKNARRRSERGEEFVQGDMETLYTDKGRAYSLHLGSHLPKETLSTKVSEHYDSLSREGPSSHHIEALLGQSSSGKQFPPRQLVVLDLNGSLLVREPIRRHSNHRHAWRRPYVACLVQYLAHELTTNAVLVEQKTRKRKYHILPSKIDQKAPSQESTPRRGKRKRPKKKRLLNPMNGADEDEQRLLNLEESKKKIRKHPDRYSILAPLDAMVWSSVQPHNITSMVDIAFGENQRILRACWTRCMLGLDESGFHQKVQTTKNLERIWWSSDNRYTASSTVLLDDSALKARLQPWSLLQIAEYQLPDPKFVDESPWQNAAITAKQSNTYSPSHTFQLLPQEPTKIPGTNETDREGTSEEELPREDNSDETLLAVIGVLEELRSQANIPAWIRKGGLWAGFSSPLISTMESGLDTTENPSNHSPSQHGEDVTENRVNGDLTRDMSPVLQIPDVPSDRVPAFWCTEPGVFAHWVKKGMQALRSRGISIEVGIVNTTEDKSLQALQAARRSHLQ